MRRWAYDPFLSLKAVPLIASRQQCVETCHMGGSRVSEGKTAILTKELKNSIFLSTPSPRHAWNEALSIQSITRDLYFVRIWRACPSPYDNTYLLSSFVQSHKLPSWENVPYSSFLSSNRKMVIHPSSHLLWSASQAGNSVLTVLRWGMGGTLFCALLQLLCFACELWSRIQPFPGGLIAGDRSVKWAMRLLKTLQ